MSNYGLSTVPPWIAIDPITGNLTITASNVIADTDYYFYVTSSITNISNPAQKLKCIYIFEARYY